MLLQRVSRSISLSAHRSVRCLSQSADRGGVAKIEAALGAPGEIAKGRSTAEQAALIQALSQEFRGVPPPPAGSVEWPASLVRRWHEDGGALRLAALAAEAPETRRRFVDDVGLTLPVNVVEPAGSPTIMGAVEAGNTAFLDAVAAHILLDDGFVTLRLGLDTTTLDAVAAEAEEAWPLMRPGEIKGVSPDAESFLVGGASPSGMARGDRYLLFGELDGGRASFPALARAHAALSVVADALAPRLPVLEIGGSSDTFIARFPGDGLGYNAHYDGADGGLCRLTAILYTTRNWTPECGGQLLMLDRRERGWWSVEPNADTLIIFRSEYILHKVLPCFTPRVALTAFLSKVL